MITKRMIMLFALAAAIASVLAAQLAVPAATAPRELPVYSVQRDDKAISVTFDCAWNADDIDEIIAVLDKYKCPGTFFVVGDWAEKYPDAVKKLAAAGHEVANHSYDHAHYSRLSKDAMKTDMDKADSVIESLTGNKSRLFRAPYGEYNNDVVRACAETARFCIQWDVDSLDWQKLTTGQITERVVSKTKSGSIILLHNGTPNTAKALTQILPKLTEQGYTFLPVSQLIFTENYTIDHTGRQWTANN